MIYKNETIYSINVYEKGQFIKVFPGRTFLTNFYYDIPGFVLIEEHTTNTFDPLAEQTRLDTTYVNLTKFNPVVAQLNANDTSDGVVYNTLVSVSGNLHTEIVSVSGSLKSDINSITGGVVTDGNLILSSSISGTVYRTQQQRNSDIINVKDYGAIGDGIADDTNAIQDAITKSCLVGCKCIIPNGVYKITSRLLIPESNSWCIDGNTFNTRIIQYTNNEPIFYFANEGVHSFSICNLNLSWNNFQNEEDTNSIAIAFDTSTELGWGYYNFTIENITTDKGFSSISIVQNNKINPVWGGLFQNIRHGMYMKGWAILLDTGSADTGLPNNVINRLYIRADSISSTVSHVVRCSRCNNLRIYNMEVNNGQTGALQLVTCIGFLVEVIRDEGGTFSNNYGMIVNISNSIGSIRTLEIQSKIFNIPNWEFFVKADTNSDLTIDGITERSLLFTSGQCALLDTDNTSKIYTGYIYSETAQSEVFLYDNSVKNIRLREKFRSSSGTPYNVETPNFVGEEIFDNVNNLWYKSTSLLSSSWISINDKQINVKDFGVVADGITDDSNALEDVINFANGSQIQLSKGTILITRPLNITVKKYSLKGQRLERGCSAYQSIPEYATSIIKYRPLSNAPMIKIFSNETPFTNMIGPFEHSSITFDCSGTDFFVFGDETDPIVTDGLYQQYIFGVQFKDCAICDSSSWIGQRNIDGTINRPNTCLLKFIKCFESGVWNTSFSGGDYQVITIGCDYPTFESVRSQRSMSPFTLRRSGTFGVHHTLKNIQIEGWLFGAINNKDVDCSSSDIKLENNNTFTGWTNLTTTYDISASILTDGIVTLSKPVDNIIFPYETLVQIKFTDGSIFNILPTTVSGTSMEYETTYNTTPILGSNFEISINIGFGIISHGGQGQLTATNLALGAAVNSPALVYSLGRGPMTVNGAVAEYGNYLDIGAMIIGNRLNSGFYMNGRLALKNCSALIVGDTTHPYLDYDSGGALATPIGYTRQDYKIEQILKVVNRQWVFGPGSLISSYANAHLLPVVKLPVNSNSTEVAWGIKIPATFPFPCVEPSIITDVGKNITIRIRIRSVEGLANLVVVAGGNGYDTLLNVQDIGTTWQVLTINCTVPVQWSSTTDPNTVKGFHLVPTLNDVYFAGAILTVNE